MELSPLNLGVIEVFGEERKGRTWTDSLFFRVVRVWSRSVVAVIFASIDVLFLLCGNESQEHGWLSHPYVNGG